MITCIECIERFKSWGDDPRVKSGRYHKSSCDYCNKPQYYIDLEQIKNIKTDEPKQDTIARLHTEQVYLRKKLFELEKKTNQGDRL